MSSRFVLKLASMVYRPQKKRSESGSVLGADEMEKTLDEIFNKKK